MFTLINLKAIFQNCVFGTKNASTQTVLIKEW